MEHLSMLGNRAFHKVPVAKLELAGWVRGGRSAVSQWTRRWGCRGVLLCPVSAPTPSICKQRIVRSTSRASGLRVPVSGAESFPTIIIAERMWEKQADPRCIHEAERVCIAGMWRAGGTFLPEPREADLCPVKGLLSGPLGYANERPVNSQCPRIPV